MKKKKPPIYDDGRVIVNMNVEGMPWYNPNREKYKKDKRDRPSHRERRAMVFGGLKAALPFFLITVVMFTLVMLLMTAWLH